MSNTLTLRGLATINFYAADHAGAKKWYAELFGIQPYFDVPGYFEFRLGDYQQEFGIIDGNYAPNGIPEKATGQVAHWHVDNLQASLDKLIAHGATLHLPPTDHSDGKGTFVTASVLDPFGNIFGIMTNQHYLDIFSQKNKSR